MVGEIVDRIKNKVSNYSTLFFLIIKNKKMKIIATLNGIRDSREYKTLAEVKKAYGSAKYPAKLIINKSVFVPALGYVTIRKVPNSY
jgi:hypothetical protein